MHFLTKQNIKNSLYVKALKDVLEKYETGNRGDIKKKIKKIL